jgi:ketosteroid isomerase-like protein
MTEIDWEARIREALDAFNREDYETALRHATDDIELRRIDTSPDSRDPIRGRDQVIEFWRPEVFEEQRAELLELISLGDDTIITKVKFSARGAASGLDVPPLESFVVWYLRDDKISKLAFFGVLADAERAAESGPT